MGVVAFQRRPVENGTSVHTAGPFIAPPAWLRLTRTGDVIAAFYRTADTGPWVEAGTQEIGGLAQEVHAGLAVSSHEDGTLATATFENVTVRPVPPGT